MRFSVPLSLCGILLASCTPPRATSAARASAALESRIDDTLSTAVSADVSAFGGAVDVSADGASVVVGDGFVSVAGAPRAGNARVFVRGGVGRYVEQALFEAPDPEFDDRCGSSVAISDGGDVVIVGCPTFRAAFDPQRAATARVFVRSGSTWTADHVFEARAYDDFFGEDVAISGDGQRAFIGAHTATVGATHSAGEVTVFVRGSAGWSEEATLVAPVAQLNALFGASIAANRDGSVVVIGAQREDTERGDDAGRVHVFTRSGSTWAHSAALEPAAPTLGRDARDNVGWSVAISDDGAIVLAGAQYADVGERTSDFDHGRAYVFEREDGEWVERATLAAPEGESFDRFGASIALAAAGDRALIGADGARRVFVMARGASGWTIETTIDAPGGSEEDNFGDAIAASSTAAIAIVGGGSSLDDAGELRAAAYVVSLVGSAGDRCSTADECGTGHCVDGVCCESACGGSVSDCQACDSASTGVASGTCAPLASAVAATVVCRAASSSCDVAETCTADVPTCPDDVIACDDAGPGERSDGGRVIPATDAAAGTDAGIATAPPAPSGCACAAIGLASGGGLPIVLGLAIVLVVTTRRRARRAPRW